MPDAGATDPIVKTRSGALRGRREGAVATFRGIPYAAPPLGPLRFRPPQPLPAWTGTRDALADGPVAPQGRSRLAHVMGEFDRPQGEDCLTLTLWTQGPDGPKRPVVVWIHGGAYMSGAGSIPWYSGEHFADEGDLVAVSINYRLGALGFLHLPGLAEGNMGLLDQVAALQWVRDNIAACGGDPENVTVVGQSAGGHAIAALMGMPAARGLFRRAILQSPPMGMDPRTPAEAAELGQAYRDILGIAAGEEERLRSVPVPELLKAQGALAGRTRRFAETQPPFQLVGDGTVVPADLMTPSSDVDVMIGTTREEMAAFYTIDQSVKDAAPEQVSAFFAEMLGADGPAVQDEYRRMRGRATAAALLGDLNSDRRFRMHSLRFAERLAARGHPAYVFQFDWQSPAGFEACHCIEIPFMFGNLEHWTDSPMLEGADAAVLAGLARQMHGAWTAFARSGDPNHADLAPWSPYTLPRRVAMRFDTMSDPVDDLAGLSWRRAWPG